MHVDLQHLTCNVEQSMLASAELVWLTIAKTTVGAQWQQFWGGGGYR